MDKIVKNLRQKSRLGFEARTSRIKIYSVTATATTLVIYYCIMIIVIITITGSLLLILLPRHITRYFVHGPELPLVTFATNIISVSFILYRLPTN
jgi:cytochrome b subunit of formate dehydrogenase